MSRDYLTESQADTLMQQMQSQAPINRADGARPAEVRPYEFARDEPLADAVRTALPFDRLHQTLLPDVRTVLFELTRQRPTVSVKPLPALRFDALQATWQEPCLLYHVRLEPMGVPVIVVFDGVLIAGLVDLIFGGDGAPPKRSRRKTLSHSEAQVAGKFMDRMFNVLNTGWSDLLPLHWQRQRLESQPQFANFLAPDIEVGGYAFTVAFGDTEAALSLYYQLDGLHALDRACGGAAQASAPGTQDADGVKAGGPVWGHQIRQKLQSAELEVVAQLTEFQLTIAELISLQRGDIIPISAPREVIARIGERAVFSGGFGQSQGRCAIRIEHKLTGIHQGDAA